MIILIGGRLTKSALHEEVNTNWMQCDPTKSGGPHFVHLVRKRTGAVGWDSTCCVSSWTASQVQAYGRAEATSMRCSHMLSCCSHLSMLLLLLPGYSAIQGSPARHLCSRTMSTGLSRRTLPRGCKTPCSNRDGDVECSNGHRAGMIGMWP